MAETLTVATTETVDLAEVATRREHDLLGERDVPDDAYWACRRCARSRTSRSPACRSRDFPELVEALAAVKQAAALANARARPARRASSADAIVARLRRDHRDGRHHEHFVVDMIQGGAGTSTNMNANEVIANRALELIGHATRRLRSAAPEQPRQPQPVDQRRLSDGGASSRCILRIERAARRA